MTIMLARHIWDMALYCIRLSAALSAWSQGLRLDPDELHFRKAVLHRKAGQPVKACWRRILTPKRPAQFCSVDQGIYGQFTLRNLGVLAEKRGNHTESRRLWRMVNGAFPGDPDAMSRVEAASWTQRTAVPQRSSWLRRRADDQIPQAVPSGSSPFRCSNRQ
jgi:hypothetical protein